MAIKAWGPLFAWLVLSWAGITGLFMEHPEPHNRGQPTVAPYDNSYSDELAATHSSNQHGKKGEQERSWVEGFFDKPTDTLLLVFNGLLALFTYRLYSATSGLFKETAELRRIADEQRVDLSRSIAAAEKSAEAAKHSADATIALERPYLFAVEAMLVQPNGPNDLSPHITYSISNLGRVPGIIRAIYAEAILREKGPLDRIVTYREEKFTFARTPIPGGLKTVPNSLLPVSFDEPVGEQDYVDVKDGTKMILFKVLLVYSGPLDFTYYSAIANRIDINTGGNYPVGGDAYNYEKTEKGRATKIMPEIRIIP
jgi:hypothetical protein